MKRKIMALVLIGCVALAASAFADNRHGGWGGHSGFRDHGWRGGDRCFGGPSFAIGFGFPFYGFYPGYGFYPYGGYYPYGYPYGGYYPYYYGSGAYPYAQGGQYYYGAPGYGLQAGRGTNRGVVVQVQQRLAGAGFYRGAIDGVMGDRTRYAIRAFERMHGLPVDGRIDGRLLAAMGLS